MKDVLLYGIHGRMGRAVYAAAERRRDFNVVCGVDKHVFGNFDCPVFTSLKEVSGHVDAIIDFSSPSALDDILSFAREYGCALVLATTGYTERQKEQIREISQYVPVCASPNMSKGIRAIEKILPALRSALDGFDVSIVETHGRHKKDKPSGTALALKEGALPSAEIASLRGGDVPGVHEIVFLGEKESVTIRHAAFSREIFAEGALDECAALLRRSGRER